MLMKTTIVKKAGKVKAVVVPNPNIDLSCTVIAARGMAVEEVELTAADVGDRKRFVNYLEKLGVQVARESSGTPAKRRSRRR
jgi:hypothetical protein